MTAHPLSLFIPLSEVVQALKRHVAIAAPELAARGYECEWRTVADGIVVTEIIEEEKP